jgi:hypothetical protein
MKALAIALGGLLSISIAANVINIVSPHEATCTNPAARADADAWTSKPLPLNGSEWKYQ